MRLVLWAALLFWQCCARVTFLGYPNNGVIAVSCQSTVTFPVGSYFAQTCLANNCAAPVTFSINPDLTQYGVSLNQISPVTLIINPNPLAVTKGTLTTTITATDQDGPSASSTMTINFDCPLRLSAQIPNQNATEGQLFTFDTSPYFSNPSRNVLTWTVEGLPSSSSLAINSQGILSGTPTYTEASLFQPLKLVVTATDSVTRRTVRSNTFDLQIAQKPGISFPSALGQIPAQTATEGVLFQFAAGNHFANPSNFAVVWSLVSNNNAITSSMRIDSSTGTISITPSANDLLLQSRNNNQPFLITVSGRDERGNVARSNTFSLTIKPSQLSVKNVPMPLPPVLCGSVCCAFNLSDFVYNPSANPLRFTLVSGLPYGSQIRLLPDGTLTGVASLVDVQASPLALLITVSNTNNYGDNNSGGVTLNPIIFSVTPITAPILVSAQPSGLNRTVKVNSNVQIDVSSYFVIPSSNIVTTWSLSSVSPSFSIDSTGKVRGAVTEQDYLLQSSSSLSFVVTASNKNSCGGGSVSLSFSLTIDPNWQGPSCNNYNNTVPTNVATCEKSVFRLDLSKYCVDPRGSILNYSITGLPLNSGLFFDSSKGILSGSSTSAASDVGNAAVTVCATNTRGAQDCMSFVISFQRPKRAPIVDPPIPSPVTAIKGQRFVGYFNFHFYEADMQPLIYSVAGLPVGSGMGIGPVTGIFSGIPNEADLRASPLVLSVFASNEQNVGLKGSNVCSNAFGGGGGAASQGGRARADLIVIVQNPASPPICRALPAQSGSVQVGQFWASDLSRYFSPGEGGKKLEFALRSLPRGSGLSIDPISGVISGVLTQQDATNSPLSLSVAATNGYGSCQSALVLSVGQRAVAPLPFTPPFTPSTAFCPLAIQNIYPQTIVEGASMNLNLKEFVASTGGPTTRLSFVSSGLPKGSGFMQDTNGMFYGSPSAVDVDIGSLTIVTTVSCENQGSPVSKQWQLIVSRRNGGGPSLNYCNACNMNNGGCQQQCVVLNAQARCAASCGCSAGFVLNADGKTCRLMSGCDQNNGGCKGICSSGSIQGLSPPVCSCASNWLLQSDKQTCRYDACGSNNGGCEQVCTSDGAKPRCDCRTGSLNSDGRTCSSDIIVVGTIPPALVLGCQYFLFDLSTVFSRTGGGQLSYTVSGLPPQTGFSVSAGGLLAGTPSSADCAMPQPITISLNAAASNTNAVRAVMFMSTFCGTPNLCGSQIPSLTGGTATTVSNQPKSIPVLNANVCESFRFDLAPYFTGGQGSIQFSVLGLPQGTGFQLATVGLMSGVPTSRDCAESPLSLTIVARDALGRTSKSIITIRFSSCNCVQDQQQFASTTLTTTINLPSLVSVTASTTSTSSFNQPLGAISRRSDRRIHNTALCGQPFFVDCAEVFRVSGLSYSMKGLPPNTGLRLSETGVISGTPNNADARASPVDVYVTAIDRFGVSEALQVEVEVLGDCGGLPAPVYVQSNFRSMGSVPAQDSNTGILPIQVIRPSQLFRLDLSLISFSGLGGALTYEANGLPEKSGLALSKSGVLTGYTDCVFAPSFPLPTSKPFRVDVRVVNSVNESASNYFYMQFACDESASARAAGEVGGLPAASGLVGQLFYYDTSPFFTTPTTDISLLMFECVGVVEDSQLSMSKRGVISGVLSDVDLNTPALLVSVKTVVENKKTGENETVLLAQRTLRLLVVAKLNLNSSTSGSNSLPVFVPLSETLRAPVSKNFALNVGERFYDKDDEKLSFFALDLSILSGLKFNNKTGILSGEPNVYDVQQIQPVRIRVYAQDEKGGKGEGEVFISFGNASTTTPAAISFFSSFNRDPVCISIRRQTATQGKPFVMSVASGFVDQDGDLLTYSVSGLPMNSGLAIDSSGLISGTPNQADARALQPLLLTATVVDEKGGRCEQDFLLTVFHAYITSDLIASSGEAMKKNLVPAAGGAGNHAPIAQLCEEKKAYVDELLIVRASFSFADVDGDMLSFNMTGQPLSSGLTINAMAGIVFGVPSFADLSASPLALTISADDKQGGNAQCVLKVTILPSRKIVSGSGKRVTSLAFTASTLSSTSAVSSYSSLLSESSIQTRQMPRLSYNSSSNNNNNSQFFFLVRNYFDNRNNNNDLTYEAYGLPVSTGFVLDKIRGILSGVPNKSDYEAKQPLAIGLVACEDASSSSSKDGSETQQCAGNILFVTLISPTYVSSTAVLSPDYVISEGVSPLGVPEVKFQVGTWGFFQTSRLLASSTAATAASSSVVYDIAGIDFTKSGLQFDASSGAIFGTPNLNDLISADSCAGRCVPIVVTAATTANSNSNVYVQTFVLKFITSRAEDVNHAPFALAIPAFTVEKDKMLVIDMWKNFVDPDGDALSFSVLGLPQNSGFSLVVNSGIFFGLPSSADLLLFTQNNNVLVLTVVAKDLKGGQVQETLSLTFLNSSISSSNNGTRSRDSVSYNCKQLGWSVSNTNTNNNNSVNAFCSRAIKVANACPSKMNFFDAEKACVSLGTRLCTSQELSFLSAVTTTSSSFAVSSSAECVVDRVWSASECGLSSEAVVQSSRNAAKECQSKNGFAMLKCCASDEYSSSSASLSSASRLTAPASSLLLALPSTSAATLPLLSPSPLRSEKTCDQLTAFVTSPSAVNKAVCSSAQVGAGGVCPQPSTFAQAAQLCAKSGARLCTPDEISQDIGNTKECEVESQRVWSSAECVVVGRAYSQAGVSTYLSNKPKQCSNMTELLSVYCCADHKAGAYFQNLRVNSTKNTIKMSWSWKVFPTAQVNYRKATSVSAIWITPQAGRSIVMGKENVSLNLQGLDSNSRYTIRITPVNSKSRAISTQAVEFRATTSS